MHICVLQSAADMILAFTSIFLVFSKLNELVWTQQLEVEDDRGD